MNILHGDCVHQIKIWSIDFIGQRICFSVVGDLGVWETSFDVFKQETQSNDVECIFGSGHWAGSLLITELDDNTYCGPELPEGADR